MAQLQPDNRKITASDLYNGTMIFKPDNAYEAAKFQQIAFALDITWANNSKSYKTDYDLTKNEIVIEGSKLLTGKKITTPHVFGLADISPELFPEMKPLSLEDLSRQQYWFIPQTKAESLLLQKTLFDLGFPWYNSASGNDHVLTSNDSCIKRGIFLRENNIRDFIAGSDCPVFCEIAALPEPPLDPRFAKLFNAIAAKDAMLEQQADIIQKQSALINKIYGEINHSTLKFDKGLS